MGRHADDSRAPAFPHHHPQLNSCSAPLHRQRMLTGAGLGSSWWTNTGQNFVVSHAAKGSGCAAPRRHLATLSCSAACVRHRSASCTMAVVTSTLLLTPHHPGGKADSTRGIHKPRGQRTTHAYLDSSFKPCASFIHTSTADMAIITTVHTRECLEIKCIQSFGGLQGE